MNVDTGAEPGTVGDSSPTAQERTVTPEATVAPADQAFATIPEQSQEVRAESPETAAGKWRRHPPVGERPPVSFPRWYVLTGATVTVIVLSILCTLLLPGRSSPPTEEGNAALPARVPALEGIPDGAAVSGTQSASLTEAGRATENRDRKAELATASQRWTSSIGMTLVRIPAGEFMMGASDVDVRHGPDEKPRHLVRITRPFYLSIYEVTQAEYQAVMGKSPSFFSSSGDGHRHVKGLDTSQFPIESITWEQAVEFCRRLSALPEEQQAGRAYRLPTEAEWEYACRGGTQTVFCYGDSLSAPQANFNGKPYGQAEAGQGLARTAAVGSYKPNALGLYDMHGNVWEWCSDWYQPDYYGRSPTDDPPGPDQGSDRVIRGGAWSFEAGDCRSATRFHGSPDYYSDYRGFRVACDLK